MLFPLFVRAPKAGECWICLSKTNPSREHKFKASDLRRHFGKAELFVGSADETSLDGRIAQGPKSDFLKFQSTICERCNSSVTQESDLAYDQFIRLLETGDSFAEEFYNVFSDPRFCEGPNLASYIPLFRYFGKILGCHLADFGAPIPLHLSRFVAKETDQNCIWLSVRRDPTYQRLSTRLVDEELRYAAHGGLIVITKEPKLLPSRLYTTMTVGQIQFIFFFVLKKYHVWEMQLRHSEFVRWCSELALREKNEPTDPSKLEELGLTKNIE